MYQIESTISQAELANHRDKLHRVHRELTAAFMALPNGAGVEAPVLYHALAGASSAVATALDSLATLRAVLDTREELARL